MRQMFKYVFNDSKKSIESIEDVRVPEGLIRSESRVIDSTRFLTQEGIESVSSMFKWADQSRDASANSAATKQP